MVLLAILLLSAAWSYNRAIQAANHAYDRSLTTAIKGIAESIHATGGHITVNIPYSALDIFEEGVQERVFYAIIGPQGDIITGYDDLPFHGLKGSGEEPKIVDTVFREQPIRLAALSKRLYDPELAGGDSVTVLFAETTEARTRLAFSLFIDSLRPQLLLLSAGLILVLLVLRSAFRPLLDLRDTIRQRKDEDLTPVSETNVPNELLPLVDAIKEYLELPEEERSKSFRFVVIDEAFGRGSDESAQYGLELFRQLNLQLLIITPLQKIHIIEPYVSSVGFVHNEGGRDSKLRNLSIEEYQAQKAERPA